jgi:hypothetical protein
MGIMDALRDTHHMRQERGDEKTKKIRLGRPSESAGSNDESAI